MRKSFIAVLLAVSLATAALFSGCAAIVKNAAEGAIKKAAAQAGVSYDTTNSGGITINTSGGTAQIGGNVSWPSNWPSELPKMDGTITNVMNTFNNSGGGIFISLNVSNADVAKNYANQFASLGYAKFMEDAASDSYIVEYVGKYTIAVTVSNTNEVTISLGQGTASSAASTSSDSSTDNSSGDSSSDS